MTTVEANGVTLGVAHFGDAAAPLVLCAGGTTMLSWPDALCESLARGGRHVVRYDLRDSGASIDDERLRRTRERHVELAQVHRRGLDDDDVVELEAFRGARREQRNGFVVR